MSEERIPTLPRELDNEEKNENNEIKELPIDEKAVNENKINSAKDLLQEMEKMGVDIQQIAKIIVSIKEKESQSHDKKYCGNIWNNPEINQSRGKGSF